MATLGTPPHDRYANLETGYLLEPLVQGLAGGLFVERLLELG
jgi:hypothetical protein